MSRANIEERTLFLKQHTGGASKAVWPSSIRRYVAVGKGRRRIVILKRLLILYKLQKNYLLQIFDKIRSFSKRVLAGCSCTIHIVVMIVASEIIQLLFVFYNKIVLLVITIICTVIVLSVIHLIDVDIEKCHEYSLIFKHKVRTIGLRREKQRQIESRLTELPKSPQASMPFSMQDEEIKQESMVVLFPDTPMPRTPLIRVMETINLSSSLSALQDFSATTSPIEEPNRCADISSQE